MEAAARRLGLEDADACAERAVSGALKRDEQHVLAECLTVGETYFFRDPALFEQLATQVLPPLIAARRGSSRRLRLWSAGCSSGEEAYSLAMLVASLLPDWREWNISILGTDLNPAALHKARTATYGRWSLRGAVPGHCRQFLQPAGDGQHRVAAELLRIVRFEQLNLAADHYPSAQTMTLGMDVVLCRNVLIYFEPSRVPGVLARLGQALVDDGWLVTGSVEIPRSAVRGLRVVRDGGLFALRPATAQLTGDAAAAPPPRPPAPPRRAVTPLRAPRLPAAPAPAVQDNIRPPDTIRPPAADGVATFVQQARERANAGDLAQAERLCRLSVEQDKLDPDCTYLLASILAERGAFADAMAALQRTLYLAPDHLPARFALGSLALRQGRADLGRRHFAQVSARLAAVPADEVVAGSGGLLAGELREAIRRAELAGA